MKEKEQIGPLKSKVNWDEYLNDEDFGPEPVRRQLKKILEHLNRLTYHDEVNFDITLVDDLQNATHSPYHMIWSISYNIVHIIGPLPFIMYIIGFIRNVS